MVFNQVENVDHKVRFPKYKNQLPICHVYYFTPPPSIFEKVRPTNTHTRNGMQKMNGSTAMETRGRDHYSPIERRNHQKEK